MVFRARDPPFQIETKNQVMNLEGNNPDKNFYESKCPPQRGNAW